MLKFIPTGNIVPVQTKNIKTLIKERTKPNDSETIDTIYINKYHF